MKTILTLLAILLSSYMGFSQNWQPVISNDSITISAQEIHYQDLTNDIDHQRLVFKYKNKTSSPLHITFNRELIYNGKTYPQEEKFSVLIPANGMVQYNNSKNNSKSYYIFKKDNQGWIKNSLNNYSIIHLKVR